MAEQFGYNTGNVLESILAGQEAKKRQAMLDDVNKQNVESEIATRADNAATNKFNRESLAADRKSKDDERAAGGAEETALANWAKSQKSDDPTIQSMYGILAVHPRLGKELLPKIYDQVLANQGKKKTGGNIFTVKPNGAVEDSGQGWSDNGPTVRQLPQPSQPNAASLPQLFQEDVPNDPKDATKGTHKVSYWLHAGEQPTDKNMIQGGALHKDRQDPRPPVVKPVTDYDQKALTLYQNALKNSTTSTPQERASKLQGFMNTITNPKKRADVQAIIQHPTARNMSVDDLVKSGALTPDPTDPTYIQSVGSILGAIRGQQ